MPCLPLIIGAPDSPRTMPAICGSWPISDKVEIPASLNQASRLGEDRRDRAGAAGYVVAEQMDAGLHGASSNRSERGWAVKAVPVPSGGWIGYGTSTLPGLNMRRVGHVGVEGRFAVEKRPPGRIPCGRQTSLNLHRSTPANLGRMAVSSACQVGPPGLGHRFLRRSVSLNAPVLLRSAGRAACAARPGVLIRRWRCES